MHAAPTIDATAANAGPSLWRGRRRYVMLLLFFASLINYIDRVSLSVAAPAVSKEFGLDAAKLGVVLSAFLWTYALCLVPMGWLVDRLGPRLLNTGAISFWSLAAMATGAAQSFGVLVASRLALGAGEASTMPSGSKVVRQWFTRSERGLATALARSGAEAGPALGMPLVAWLVGAFGWRVAFVVTGAIGFVWLIFWLKFFRDDPRDSAWLPPAERDFLAANTDAKASAAPRPGADVLFQLLRQPTMWGLALSEGCIMYLQYLILTWLPTYFMEVRHLKLMQASLVSSAAFVGAWVFGIAVCRLSDRGLTPEKLRAGARRRPVIACMALSSVFVLVPLLDNLTAIFLLVTVAKGLTSASIGLNMSLTNDLTENPAVAGTVFGVLLLGGNALSSLAPLATGYLVKTSGNFDSAFYLAGALVIIGALLSLLATRTPLRVANGV